MNRELNLQDIAEMEALADLQIKRAMQMKKDCHKARQKLEGVSTPSSARKGLHPQMVAVATGIVAKRNARILSINKNPQTPIRG